MTAKQRKKVQAKKRREKEREKRARRKAREAKWKAARKARKELRMAPKRALVAWSVEVRSIGYCVVCGPRVKHKLLHAHHILPKERYKEFKLKSINGVPLCPMHHKFGKYSAHRNPVWFVIWLREHQYKKYAWAKRHMGEDDTCQRTSSSKSSRRGK